MVQIIRVGPVDGGWTVDCEGAAEPAVYLSGAKAEATARLTAARLAAAGQDVRIDILDRDSREAGIRWFDAGSTFPGEAGQTRGRSSG